MWKVDGDLLTLLLVFWLSYVLCWVWMRRGGNRTASIGRLVCWSSGLFVVSIALMSAIDTMAYSYLYVHMIQHMLLMEAAPPLLILGRPLSVWQVAFSSERIRQVAEAFPLRKALVAGLSFILKPPVAWGLSAATISVWHFPVAYDFALAHPSVHEYLEHTTLFLSSLAWWHPLIGSLPQFPYLSASRSRFLYVLAGMIPLVLVGVIILFAPHVIYSYYLGVQPTGALSGMADQEIGALIMLASDMTVLFAIALPLQYIDKVPLSYP